MKGRYLSLLLILAGVIVLLYPTLNDRYESYQQQKIMKQWQDNLKYMDQAVDQEETESSPVWTPTSLSGGSADVQPKPLVAEATSAPVVEMPKNMEGVLLIDKINLKIPILTNATQANMKVSVASIANTGRPGAVGNYAIAGHRNLTYGKNFNRLDEVDVGDLITVDTGTKQYTYKVEKKLYVLPEEVWVLNGNDKDREITLITCHPMENPTHRIAIKGKLIETK
ncbi:class D sortase [Paenibacillus sp. HWE-109]|uniref:class D sortase n=1 Tax=Paenibacillus sp. HWE-109 TaxID=1306526 RepID=UPI001EDFCC90|nr:class D sortase [Paenibacillus sp. HWE-109]UKS26236.1 class D sortase [Paenibacillus sp. HWE-109]